MFIQAIYLFIIALVVAFLEVQIEGKHGWAAKLPTWRPDQRRWYSRLWQVFAQGKDLTGYHLGINFLVLLIFHYPFFAGLPWAYTAEAWTFARFFLFCGYGIISGLLLIRTMAYSTRGLKMM
jgi:hypothetical protein